jgi:hypothetical protein
LNCLLVGFTTDRELQQSAIFTGWFHHSPCPEGLLDQ